MPSEYRLLRCGNCGASLSAVPGQNVATCRYCSEITHLTPRRASGASTASSAPPPEQSTGLGAQLLSGPGAVPTTGRGARYDKKNMTMEALVPAERAIWPTRAAASTTFGGSWSPSAMVGPPKVFPRYGDIPGAWAPSSQISPVEWVELEYTSEQPVTALRVYETNASGAVYAVVDRTSEDELLYAGSEEPHTVACALEVTLDAPRVIRKLRVYLTNTRSYAEIDTVALLSQQPLPLAERREVPRPTRAPSVGAGLFLMIAAFAALVLSCIVLSLVIGSDGTRTGGGMTPPSETLQGATIAADASALDGLLAQNPVWAASVVDFSSQYSSSANAAMQALGPPNVYPRAGDIAEAWAPESSDGGVEYVTVRFTAPVSARAVVWLATLNPGAVVRVDDLTNPRAPVMLWTGTDPSRSHASAVVTLSLPAPRTIQELRLYVNTAVVRGWNELDAIALIP